MRDGTPVAVPVTTGLDDGSFTEIVQGDLHPGDQVITAEGSPPGGLQPAPPRRAFEIAPMQHDGPAAPQPIIKVENVTRSFLVGDVEVQALRGIDLDRPARRIRRHYGLVGLRQVDADEYPRLPRPADQRSLLA